MAQPYIQADGVRVEPGSGQTLTISRDAATGSLRFVDAVITSGINLSEMASLATVSGVLIVGVSGAGAKYTTIQSAINAVPSDAGLTNPYVVLVMPGVYSENLTIEKAGITVQGIGRVVVTAATATPTVTVQSSVSTTPTSLTLRNLVIVQPNAGQACVSLVGAAASTLGDDGIIIDDCNLTASGAGSYTILATTMNFIAVRNCMCDGTAPTGSLKVSQCAALRIVGGEHPNIQADYNSAGTLPSESGSFFYLSGCTAGNLQSTLTGGGTLQVDKSSVGNITMYGNRTLSVSGSSTGNLSINGTTAATLSYSTHGSVAGAGTLSQTTETGTLPFAASASESVVFDVARPTASYMVSLDTGDPTPSYVSAKSDTGFTVTFTAPVTATVLWTVTAT